MLKVLSAHDSLSVKNECFQGKQEFRLVFDLTQYSILTEFESCTTVYVGDKPSHLDEGLTAGMLKNGIEQSHKIIRRKGNGLIFDYSLNVLVNKVRLYSAATRKSYCMSAVDYVKRGYAVQSDTHPFGQLDCKNFRLTIIQICRQRPALLLLFPVNSNTTEERTMRCHFGAIRASLRKPSVRTRPGLKSYRYTHPFFTNKVIDLKLASLACRGHRNERKIGVFAPKPSLFCPIFKQNFMKIAAQGSNGAGRKKCA